MSKVNVNLDEAFSQPAYVLVTARSVLVAGQQVVASTRGKLPGVKSLRTNGLGVAQFDLQMGRYEITAQSASGGDAFKVTIDVPDDLLTYDFSDLLTAGTWFTPALPSGVSPVASANVSGLMKLSSGGFGVPESVDTIALARALPRARFQASKIVNILGGAAAGDGGGGVYFWKVGGTNADDGWAYLRTSDYAADGVLQRWDGREAMLIQAADQSVTSSTALVDATNLVWPLVAGWKYDFRAQLLFTTAGTVSGYKFGLAGPAAPATVRYGSFAQDNSNAMLLTSGKSFSQVHSRAVTAANDFAAEVWGYIENGVNAGNFSIQFAQRTSDGSAVTLNKGARLFIRRVG